MHSRRKYITTLITCVFFNFYTFRVSTKIIWSFITCYFIDRISNNNRLSVTVKSKYPKKKKFQPWSGRFMPIIILDQFFFSFVTLIHYYNIMICIGKKMTCAMHVNILKYKS